MPVGNPVTDLSTSGNFVPVTRTLTINGVSYDLSADRSWSIASPGGGSVTSVAMTVPTGFSVSGSPITTAGTLAVTFAAGYSLPTTVKQSNWDDAYTWVSNFPTQTGNAGKFLYTNGSVLSWQQALLNPFTVLGQIVYSGVSGSVEVLNGNTTTQRLYLQQVGTGTSSAAPSWGGIISTDITGQALTKTDDTNVTLTLGGTPGNSVLNAVSLTLGWAGTLAVSRGGSGAATLSGVLIGNGTSAFTAITGGPNQLLRVNGTATGFEFYSASFLTNPMTLNYDMIYQNAGIPARLPGNITTTKQYLTSIGNGSATTSLAWASFTNSDVPGDALTRVNDTNVTLTLGGTPSTAVLRATSLTLGWSGTLSVGRGGTGASTLTGVLIGNGTSAVTAVVGTAGQFLRRNLANTAYEFRTLQGGDIAGSELTFSNDTNVTMSLSGTPASALLQPVTIGLGWTGTLSVARGGIGVGTITGVMIGNGTSAVTGVTGTANQILRRNAGNTAYEFWTANYMTNPMTLEGSIIYATTGGTPAELFANSTSTRKYLSQINGGAPSWEALSFPTGSGTTNYLPKWTSSTVLGDSQILDNGTNVGIGISPSHKLDVNGTIGLSGTAFAVKSSTYNVIYDGGGSATLTLGDATTPLNAYDNTTHSFRNRGGGVGFAVINSTGLGVGINPSHKLDVNGNIGLAGKIFAGFGGVFHAIYDQSANQAITIGDSSNPNTFYAQTNHVFTDRPGTTTFGTFSSAGLVLSTGRLQIPSANYLTFGGAYGANIPSITGTSGTGAVLSFHPSGSSSGEKMRLSDNGQLRLNGYTSSSSFTGIVQGYLAFTSGGNIITTATPGGVSGTQNYLAKFDSTGIAVGNSRIVDDGTNFLLNGATSVVTGLNLVGNFSATESQGGSILLRRSAVPTSGQTLGLLDAYGITTGSTYQQGAGIEFRASQNWNSTSAGTEIAISTAPDNTIAPADMFVFLNNGAVRFIGRTSNPIGAAAGTMYYNSSANNMRYFNGTTWITF